MDFRRLDLTENQFWVVVWGGLALTIIVIVAMVMNSSDYEKKLDHELILKGYTKGTQVQCYQSKDVDVWIAPSGEIVDIKGN